MVPNFYAQLDIKNRGRTLRAGGPCNWQTDDVWAEIKEVTVTQGNVVASSGRGSIKVRRDRDEVWWFDVDSTDQFTYGPAQARALAVVYAKKGKTYEYEWPDAVQVDLPLNLEEIQGNVVAGFNKDYTSYLFYTFPENSAQARAWLADLVKEVATAQEVKQFNDLFRAIRKRRGDHREGVVEAAWMNLAFTHEGLGKFDVVDKNELGLLPDEFREGMRSRRVTIGDVGDNDPDQWPNGLGSKTIHALMIVAADSVEDLNREVQYFIRQAASHEVSLVFQQDGTTRPDAPGHEHFGFRDGISQPAIRGLTGSSYPQGSRQADPPRDVIAGGEFVLGYPRQQANPAEDPLTPKPEWTQDGSYLVFRRLRQDVRGFSDFLAAEAAKYDGMSVDLLGAKLLGRYRSGAPLVDAKNATVDPGTTRPEVLKKDEINSFGYLADPDGADVPRAAHIRKAYPRDQNVFENEPAKRPRILRRGIPFGQSFRHGHPPDSPFGANPEFPNDRGLCFVCYQRSIRDQFELIQCHWVNKDSVPEAGDGMDPVAAQAAPKRIRVPGTKADPLDLLEQWVTTTGGEYFFSPSISAMELLSGRRK
jgi:Dyp-type peroxidase family